METLYFIAEIIGVGLMAILVGGVIALSAYHWWKGDHHE